MRTWLRWSVLALNADFLGQPWFQLSQDYQRQRDGLAASLPLERQAVQALTLQLFHPMSQLYVQQYYTDATRREIKQMVGHIKAEFADRLKTNPWLDASTRAAALAKLSKVDIQVGYPQRWIDFSSVDIRADDHMGNNQRLAAFRLQRDLDKIGKPTVSERFADVGHTTPTVGQCRLRHTVQRHRHHRRHPAAAILYAGCRPRGELLHHGRGART